MCVHSLHVHVHWCVIENDVSPVVYCFPMLLHKLIGHHLSLPIWSNTRHDRARVLRTNFRVVQSPTQVPRNKNEFEVSCVTCNYLSNSVFQLSFVNLYAIICPFSFNPICSITDAESWERILSSSNVQFKYLNIISIDQVHSFAYINDWIIENGSASFALWHDFMLLLFYFMGILLPKTMFFNLLLEK